MKQLKFRESCSSFAFELIELKAFQGKWKFGVQQSSNDKRILVQSTILFLILAGNTSIAVIFFPLAAHSTASIIELISWLNYTGFIVFGINPLLYISLNPFVSLFFHGTLISTLFQFSRFRKCFLRMFKRNTNATRVTEVKPFSITRRVQSNPF